MEQAGGDATPMKYLKNPASLAAVSFLTFMCFLRIKSLLLVRLVPNVFLVKFDVVLKQFKLNIFMLNFFEITVIKENKYSFTNCVRKLKCWYAFARF